MENEVPNQYTTASFDISTAFYDVMFGKPAESAETLNPLEQQVCDGIAQLIEVKEVSSLVPPIPTQLIELNKALLDDTADFEELQGIIESDMALSGEIISRANAPAFRRTNKDIENISQAIASLGLLGIGDIANNIMMKRVMGIQPIYHKMFGKQIWEHSEECAVLCRALARDYDPGLCYLLGLLHDVGKVVMFKCLVDAFKLANPDDIPGGKLFKDMMVRYSLWLSWRISESWQMPEPITNAVKQQRDKDPDGLGAILKQSNLLSELNMLKKAGHIDLEQAKLIANQQGMDSSSIDMGFQIMHERDNPK